MPATPRQSEAATTLKKSKKYLAMSGGIVTNGVILRALGGTMRKFKRFRSCLLSFRLLPMLAGALMLLAAFASRANADLIAYYNFEGPPTAGFPVNLDSHPPAFFSSDNTLILSFNTNSLTAATPRLTSKSLSHRPGAQPHCARSQQKRRE